jgi:hypothetical protein
MSLSAIVFTVRESPYPPLALGFFGLGTGYLIYGTQELFGYPKRDASADLGAGVWGLWMPGFMQFVCGMYLFAGLTLFNTFRTPALYMAALAFSTFGIHWFALGWNRIKRADPRVNVGMTVAFMLISILGIIVFFSVGDHPVGGVFIGLLCVYVAEFFTSMAADIPRFAVAEKALGFFRLGTAFWLMYLTFAVALNFILNYNLPL